MTPQRFDFPPHTTTPALDCRHLDAAAFQSGGKTYRECLKGHGDVCACDKPRKCGAMCADYEKAVK